MIDWSLIPAFAAVLATGIGLHVAGDGPHEIWHDWAVAHVVCGLLFLVAVGLHVQSHRGWYRSWFRSGLGKKSPDPMKRKQFVKGMEQIAQEGAIQIFREVGGGMEEVVVGVVGVLQLEVLEYRLNTEYNVEIRMQQLPFEQLRWVKNDPDTYNLRDLDLTSDTKAVEDMKGNRLLLFTSDWAVRWAETHNDTLELSEFGNI